MSILKVANVHFESTGANRIEYLDNQIKLKTDSGNFIIIVGSSETINVGSGGAIISGINVVSQIAAAFDKANSGAGITAYTANVGNNSVNTFNISHSLNTTKVFTSVREYSSNYIVYPDIKVTTANTIVLEFVDNPTANQYVLSVIGAI